MTTIDAGHSGALPHGHGHAHHGSYLEPKGGVWATVWDWASTDKVKEPENMMHSPVVDVLTQ